MQKNNILFILISLAFLPVAYFGGEKLRNSIYGEQKIPNRPAISSTTNVGDLKLSDHFGKPFQFSEFEKDYLLVFFGYTYCPDFCPTGLSNIGEAMEKLGEDANRVQVVFVTFDPERDSVEKMAEYMGKFEGGFIGLTGTEKEIIAASKRFGVQYRISKETPDEPRKENYQFEHSLQYSLVDKKGEVAAIFRYSDGAEKLAVEIRKIFNEG